MNKSLPDEWSYDRMMLQLLGTAGTVGKLTIAECSFKSQKSFLNENKCM